MFSIICSKRRNSALCQKTVLLYLLAVLFLCTGCSKKQAVAPTNANSVKICATFYPLYIMLLNITDGVDGVELSMLAPPNTGCLHDYQLTTRDMQSLEACDILVANGAGMEDFLEKALALKKDKMIVAAEGYPLVDHNAHVWVSPAGCMYEVQRIATSLQEIDTAHADAYKKNAEAYIQNLSTLSIEMHAALDGFAGTKVITFHEAFPYFTAEFKLKPVAVIERDAGTEPSAKELAELISTIRSVQQEGDRIALFGEPQYPVSAAEVIAKETGLSVGELDPAVTGSMTKNAYLVAMRKNMTVLEQMLGGDNK